MKNRTLAKVSLFFDNYFAAININYKRRISIEIPSFSKNWFKQLLTKLSKASSGSGCYVIIIRIKYDESTRIDIPRHMSVD